MSIFTVRMRIITALLISITAIWGLSSCGGTISCQDQPISLAFNGFDSLSLAKVLLIKYEKNTDFTKVIDTAVSGTNTSQYAKDTTGFKINNLTYSVFNTNYDYRVYVYFTQRGYKIRGITTHPKTTHTNCKLCENKCKNDLSYYVNDSPYYYIGNDSRPPYIHIYR